MRIILFIAVSALFFVACNNNKSEQKPQVVVTQETASETFFPVTDYLKGQILDLKTTGFNPLRIIKQGNKLDSAWLRVEQLDSAFAIFLNPVIDTTNLKALFNENKFHDKTLNSYTFTYEPKVALPDSLLLRRWDVYVDPQSGKVRRIFIEKETIDQKSLKLSWQAGSGATVTSFRKDAKGNLVVDKEERFIWNFEEEGEE